MADDSELDHIANFLVRVHTTHTVKTIESTRNINLIADTQSILLYAGQALSSSGIILNKQYKISYKDASEGALNSSIYALIAGIRKLNAREAIASYERATSLVGIDFLSTGRDYYEKPAGNWYANVQIIVKWLTE